MALCEKILIAGFSGSGKTSLIWALKPLAPDVWESFDDLDQLIMRAHGKKHVHIASLIEDVGWNKFRLWERQILEGWLKEEGKGALALGSGTLTPLVWELFGNQRKIKFCYLDVPFELAWKRTMDKSSTPSGQLAALYEERKKVFKQISWRLDGQQSLSHLAVEFWKHLELPGQ